MKIENKTNLYSKFLFKNLIIFLIIISSYKSFANNSNGIFDINICKSEDVLSICIDLDKEYLVNLKLLNDPYRIILDFDEKINFSNYYYSKINLENNLFDNIRFAQSIRNKSRLVFDLKEPAIISKIFYEKIKNNVILKMDVIKTSRTSFSIAKHVLVQNKGIVIDLNLNHTNKYYKKVDKKIKISQKINIPKLKLRNSKNNLQNKYMVIVDPGHGGKDPGAIGSLGTLEKDITLKASKKLISFLKENKNITAKLTRYTDIYLPLRKRVNIAKVNKADIFISIHADSSPNIDANGVSVFSLSDKASDKEAKLIAKRENAVDIIPSIKTDNRDPIIIGTLIKMFQRQAMNDSALLAKKIIQNFKKTKLAVNRGHRFAGFTVLKSLNIPSVLIEVGFLSNMKEEKKLLNEQYINNFSKNLSLAIENYLLR